MIDRFRNEYSFLSNFHPCSVVIHGWTFPSAEHAFQAMKAVRPAEWWPRFTSSAMPAADAKRLGRSMPLRADWESVKSAFMLAIVLDKFERHSSLRYALCDTDPIPLEEGNDWGDHVWGTVDGVGENRLGKILMDVRGRLWQPPF